MMFNATFSSVHLQDARATSFSSAPSKYDVIVPDRQVEHLSVHDAWFANGKAVCLVQYHDVDQLHTRGQEAFFSCHETFDGTRRDLMLLVQLHDIDQSYIQGRESFFSQYDVIDGARRDLVLLVQTHDTILPDYHVAFAGCYSSLSLRGMEQRFGLEIVSREGQAAYLQCSDVKTVNGFAARFLFSMERETPVTGFPGGYSIAVENRNLALFQYDIDCLERSWSVWGSHDVYPYRHVRFAMSSTPVAIDVLDSGPRLIEHAAFFEATESSHAVLRSVFDVPASSHVLWDGRHEQRKRGGMLVYLQDEAIYEYRATLTDTVTGRETTVASASMIGFADSLAPHCVGNTEWEMELATSVCYYEVTRKPVFENPIRWRFQSHDQKHYRDAPRISDVSVVKLESSFELHFEARWPWQSIEHLVSLFQFQAMEEEDYFDLGVWRSDSFLIDTNEPPLLTLTYRRDQSGYVLHVPRGPDTKFLAVAPIRKFPMEEIGILTQVFIP
jgi:hypothetical protein